MPETTPPPIGPWLPIEQAPKDRRVLLYRPNAVWFSVVAGQWDPEAHYRRPRPHWTFDTARFEGKDRVLADQPTHYAEIQQR